MTQPTCLSTKSLRTSPKAFIKTKEPWGKRKGFYKDKSRVRRGRGKQSFSWREIYVEDTGICTAQRIHE